MGRSLQYWAWPWTGREELPACAGEFREHTVEGERVYPHTSPLLCSAGPPQNSPPAQEDGYRGGWRVLCCPLPYLHGAFPAGYPKVIFWLPAGIANEIGDLELNLCRLLHIQQYPNHRLPDRHPCPGQLRLQENQTVPYLYNTHNSRQWHPAHSTPWE